MIIDVFFEFSNSAIPLEGKLDKVFVNKNDDDKTSMIVRCVVRCLDLFFRVVAIRISLIIRRTL